MAVVCDPRLSVVVPSFNTAELTLRCLDTLFRFAPDGTEVIVVDDGSSDGSADRVRGLSAEVELICHDTPRGFTRAANAGMDRAQGELLLLLNSDTEIRQGVLDVLLAAFADAPRLGVAGAELVFPDGRSQWSGGQTPDLVWLLMLASGLPRLLSRLPGYRVLRPVSAPRRQMAWVTGAAMAVRRAAWQELGPLDERYRFYCQDLDYCVRAAAGGWQVRQIPGVRVIHHLGASIGKQSSTTQGGGVPKLLWPDLLLWADGYYGAQWARRVASLMGLCGRARVLCRRLFTPLVPAADRAWWRTETAALADGVAAVSDWQAEQRSPG